MDGWNPLGSGLHIPYEKINLKEPMSQDPSGREIGQFGVVYRAIVSGIEVAVKIPRLQNLTQQKKDKFNQEVELMSKLPNHPNVCQFLGACIEPEKFLLVTELCKGGNLGSHLFNRTEIGFVKRLRMGRDVARGMIFLHKRGVVHLDLKPENLLLDSNGNVKVADFGLSQFKEPSKDLIRKPTGTPLYMAPELMQSRPFDFKADVFSFGIILWVLVCRKTPYEGHSQWNKFVTAICEEGERPPIPPSCHVVLQNLMRQCWSYNPAERPDFETIEKILTDIIIECAISDETGRLFWNTNFREEASVPWKSFVDKFYRFLGRKYEEPIQYIQSNDPLTDNPTEEQIRCASFPALEQFAYVSQPNYCRAFEEIQRRRRNWGLTSLKSLVVEDPKNPENLVTLERFGQILALFGPVSHEQPDALFQRIEKILSKDWFYGFMTKTEAWEKLSESEPGTFLARFSSGLDQPGFVLSVVINDSNGRRTVIHTRVAYLAGRAQPFALSIPQSSGNEYFANFDDLINSKRDTLKFPLKAVPSPYQYLFRGPLSSDGPYSHFPGPQNASPSPQRPVFDFPHLK